MQTVPGSFLTYNRPSVININIGNPGHMMPTTASPGWQGPSFVNQGYDQMFNPMPPTGFGSPIMFLMNMMQSLMQMMMGGFGGGQTMPPMGGQYQNFPNPDNFWGSTNGNGYQNLFAGGSDSHVQAGNFSRNLQSTTGGHAVQTMYSGFGSNNSQNHRYGYSQQELRTGAFSQNVQNGGWNAQQTLLSGAGSNNNQNATGNSSQALITGNGSNSAQVTTGGPGSRQALKSGSNAQNLQVGAADQFTRTGNNSGTVQLNGQRQEVVGGENNTVVQASDPRNNATQIATVGEGSQVAQAGGLTQQANLTGPNSSVAQQGTGGTRSQVNVTESEGTRMTYNTNGTTGNTWEINYGDESQSRVTTLGRNMDGNHTVRNLGGGDDTQRVRFRDPRHTGDITLNGEEGNDTFIFEQMPADPDARYTVNGGTGSNTLQMPGGNFTLLNPDGTVLRQFGEGGPAITATGLSTVRIPGENGEFQTVALGQPQCTH